VTATIALNRRVPRVRATFASLAVAARNEDLRRVELAWGAAIAAEWVHFVALGVFAYKAGGASAVGVAGLVRLLPAALVAPTGVALADRLDRVRFLLAATLLGGLALAGSAAAAFAGIDGLVYALAAVVGISSTLIRPTLQALLPSLARTPEELVASNAATSTIESVGTLAGPLLAGVLVSLVPVAVVFAVAAVLVGASSVLVAWVRARGHAVERDTHERPGTFRALRSAFELMGGVPGARLVFGLMVVQTFVRGCLNVLIVVAAFRVFHVDGGGVGYMTAAIGVGGLAGAAFAMTLPRRRLARPFGISLLLWGLPIALIAPEPQFAVALALLGVVGAANSVEDVTGFTLLQRAIPDDALNRALGLFWGFAMGAVAIGSLVAPLIVRALGPRPAFLLVGSVLPVVTVAAYRGLAGLDLRTAPSVELDLLERVAMFAPLSLAAKERLAKKLVAVDVRAGECVIRSGDAGDRFYIVGDGELEVDADGSRRRVFADDYFGEIALLLEVPRTATVTASTASHLYSLRRDDFVLAVTGHPGALSASREVVESRLGVGAHRYAR
jgi:MFS family permease